MGSKWALLAASAVAIGIVVVWGCSSFSSGSSSSSSGDAEIDQQAASLTEASSLVDAGIEQTDGAVESGSKVYVLFESGFEANSDCGFNVAGGAVTFVLDGGDMSGRSCQICAASGLAERAIVVPPNGDGVYKLDFTVRDDGPDAGWDARILLFLSDNSPPRTTTASSPKAPPSFGPGQVRTEYRADGGPTVTRTEIELRRGCYRIDNIRYTYTAD